jgi:Rieske Fe-S protein
VILTSARVVVTQPTSGQFKGFSTTCPHAGCAVASVANGQILCPCHGSLFSVTDGSVVQGPAQTGLTPVAVTVKGADVVSA